MLESKFQEKLIKALEKEFDGCLIMKNDPNYIQGIPDLAVLYGGKWAALECKKSSKAKHQPNQDWYVERMNNMSFARFIFPENMEDVFNELREFFAT